MTSPGTALPDDSTAVQMHLGILQSVIERMAGNSTSCKTWCVTVVSAVLVVLADKREPDFAVIALVPIVTFFALDVYYLALERAFRADYRLFVEKIHSGTAVVADLFSVSHERVERKHKIAALKSFSIWGFYAMITTLAAAAAEVVSR